VFDYFADQIYDRLTQAQQRILLASSFLPSMSRPAVELVTRDAAAWPFLEQLYRRRLFVDVRQARSPELQFHALFLAFLRDRALSTLDNQACAALRRLAGDTLLGQQEIEAAFAAYAAAGAVRQARDLALNHCAQLISRGRWKTAVEWIESLPSDLVSTDRWLQYWLGRARLAVTPIAGRQHLEASYRLARSSSDDQCALLAAAGVVDSHILAHTDFRPLDAWVDFILAALTRDVAFPSADAEVKVRCALLIALSYRRPDDPGLDAIAGRVFDLLPGITDANLRLGATANLVGWGSTTGPIEVARRALPHLRAALGATGVTAMNAAWGWFLISWYHCLLREHRESRAAIEMVEEIARSEDLPTARKVGPIISTWLEMHANNLAAARSEADRLEAVINPAHLYDTASVAGIRAWLAVLHNEPETALVHARAAVEVFDRTSSLMHQVNHRLPGIWARILQRDFADARARVDEMRRFANRTRSNWQEMELRATEAWIALEQHDRRAAQRHLESMMRLTRERNLDHVFGRNLHPWMPALCAAALEAGVEVEYVRTQVRRWGWPPPRSRPQHWPWPVRIHTLGTFGVYLDDRPLTFARKMPRKPIALLKTLVAFGPQKVPVQRVVDSLWPDEDGDAACKAFEAALHRLRHLLEAPGVIEVSDNRISLNPRIVWTDKEAFEAAVDGLDDERAIARALDLCQGPFLPGDLEFAWSAPCRERLRARCLRAIEHMGKNREASGAYQEAVDCYRRGIEVDEMHEVFYQGLMRAYAAMQRPVDAIRTYRSLEWILRSNLGVKPSPSTRRLALAMGAALP
jgi:DNA-binding SARP family transcriptional activator